MKKFTNKIFFSILDNYIWVLVFLIVILGIILIPRFFTIQNFINMFYHASAMAMLILGMSFCLLSGEMDLSLESTFAFAPTIGVLAMVRWLPGLNPIIALFLTLIVGGFVGLTNGFLAVKLKINSFLATLAMLIVLRGLVLFLLPQGIFTLPAQYTFLGEFRFFIGNYRIPLPILIFIGIFILAHLVVSNTFFGKNLMATGSNPTGAFISGINTTKTKMYVFIISGVCGAFGGILMVGRIGSILNAMGEGDILLVFAGTVLGGISLYGGSGKIINAMGGAILLVVISTILNLSGVSPFLIRTIQGLILLVAIIIGNTREMLYKIALRKA